MLRITIHQDSDVLTFELEGRLIGPWVRELKDCWQSTLVSSRRLAVRFDLTGVTYIDAAGREFLTARHNDGAEFVACGCLMRAVVAEITDAPVSDCVHPEGKNEAEAR
jgi:hypothetical protein